MIAKKNEGISSRHLKIFHRWCLILITGQGSSLHPSKAVGFIFALEYWAISCGECGFRLRSTTHFNAGYLQCEGTLMPWSGLVQFKGHFAWTLNQTYGSVQADCWTLDWMLKDPFWKLLSGYERLRQHEADQHDGVFRSTETPCWRSTSASAYWLEASVAHQTLWPPLQNFSLVGLVSLYRFSKWWFLIWLNNTGNP